MSTHLGRLRHAHVIAEGFHVGLQQHRVPRDALILAAGCLCHHLNNVWNALQRVQNTCLQFEHPPPPEPAVSES